MKRFLSAAMPPQRIDIHDGECAITLFGNDDAQRPAVIVDQVVGIKEFLPRAASSARD